MKTLDKRGITLLELIVVIMIIGMVITTITSLVLFGYNVYGMTSRDFQVQSDVRIAMERTNILVRYSRAVFAVPDISYLDDEWDYIGLSEDQTMIMSYKWNSVTKDHKSEILIGPYDGVTFNIGFEKDDSLIKDNTLRMYFESFTNDGTTKRYDIVSGYEALNALQVVDYGTALAPATALAYRSDEFTYENFELIVNISMVIDVSGSMAWGLNNPNTSVHPTNNPSRINVLKTQASMIVNKFAENQNDDVSINIQLVPFHNHANNPHAFLDVKNATQRSTLLNNINNLNANGATNTGDGLRRSYHSLLNKQTNDLLNVSNDTIIKNYTIILVDGESNYASRYNTTSTTQEWGCIRWFLFWCREEGYVSTTQYSTHYLEADGNINNCTYTPNSAGCTPGYVHNIPQANEYVQLMGNHLADPNFVTNYLVAFARDVSQSEITFIANAANIPNERVFYATDADQLGLSFTEIQMSITNDLWHFLGPKLTAPIVNGE